MKNKWYTKQVISRVKRGGNKGLFAVGEIVLEPAQKITPLDTGELETSGSVDQDKKNLVTYISFSKIVDGAEVSVIQHENPNYNHLPGKRWKFLAEPFFSLGPAFLPSVLADELKRELK